MPQPLGASPGPFSKLPMSLDDASAVGRSQYVFLRLSLLVFLFLRCLHYPSVHPLFFVSVFSKRVVAKGGSISMSRRATAQGTADEDVMRVAVLSCVRNRVPRIE